MTDTETGAILTPTMREFYRDTPDATGSKARSVRQRTRNRIVAALGDVDLLSSTLRDEDRRAIIDTVDPLQLDDSLSKIIAQFAREIDHDRLEGVVERGVQKGIRETGYPNAEVRVTFTVDRHPETIREILERVQQTGEMSKEDLIDLVFAKEGHSTEDIDLSEFELAEVLEGNTQIQKREE